MVGYGGDDGVPNFHYNDVIMDTIASQITSLTSVYSTVYSDADQKISKLRVTGLCAGNSPKAGKFPSQMASSAENVSISWRHHIIEVYMYINTIDRVVSFIIVARIHIIILSWVCIANFVYPQISRMKTTQI